MSTRKHFFRVGLALCATSAFIAVGTTSATASSLYWDINYSGPSFSTKLTAAQTEAAPNVGALNNAGSSMVVDRSVRVYRGLGYTETSRVLTTSFNNLHSIGWGDDIGSYRTA